MTARRLLLAFLLIGAAANAGAQQPQSRFLAREDILSVRRRPARRARSADGPEGHRDDRQHVSPGADRFRRRTCRRSRPMPSCGPRCAGRASRTPLELTAQPNTPFNIPPLTVAGSAHARRTSASSATARCCCTASPESVRIDVIERLLVTQVTARPLTRRGDSRARARLRQVELPGLQLHRRVRRRERPADPDQLSGGAADAAGRAMTSAAAAVDLNTVAAPLLSDLSTIIPDTLKLQTQIPNLSVVGFSLKAPSIYGAELLRAADSRRRRDPGRHRVPEPVLLGAADGGQRGAGRIRPRRERLAGADRPAAGNATRSSVQRTIR